MKSYIWLLLGGAAAAALAFFASGIDKIKIRILGIEIESISLAATKLLVKLGISNPTKASITITQVVGTVDASARPIGTISASNLNTSILPEKETMLPIHIKLLNAPAIFELFRNLAKKNKDLPVAVNYQVYTSLGIIPGSETSVIELTAIQDLFPNASHAAPNSSSGPGGTGRAPKSKEKV